MEFIFTRLLSQRVNHETAILYIDTMTSIESPFTIYQADKILEEQARQIFKTQTSKNISYVDCTNIAFIKHYNLNAIFSFDKAYQKNQIPLVDDLLKSHIDNHKKNPLI